MNNPSLEGHRKLRLLPRAKQSGMEFIEHPSVGFAAARDSGRIRVEELWIPPRFETSFAACGSACCQGILASRISIVSNRGAVGRAFTTKVRLRTIPCLRVGAP
jgi:hypothetical protein